MWFDPGLVVTYRPRSTLRSLAWQYFNYGRWKRVVARRHPASLLPRHLASPLLLLGLAATPVLAVAGPTWAVAAVPLTYALTLTLGSLAIGIRRRSYAALLLPLALATMHLSWGIGFLTPGSDQAGTDRAPEAFSHRHRCLAVGVGSHPVSERRGDHRGGDRLGVCLRTTRVR